jgi:hypothetical protein
MKKTQGAAPAEDAQTSGTGLVEAQQRLRRMVLDSVPSANSRSANSAVPLQDLCTYPSGGENDRRGETVRPRTDNRRAKHVASTCLSADFSRHSAQF